MRVGDLVKLLWNDGNYYGKTGIVISLQKPPTKPGEPMTFARSGLGSWERQRDDKNAGGDGHAHATLVQWLNDASEWWVRRADLEVVSESR